MTRFITLLLALLPLNATAQEVLPCDWQASSQALVEPWEDNTRLFANGKVRIALLDTIEPAAGAFYLLILSPPYDELGGRQCRVIGASQSIGFGGLSLEGMQAGYDPSLGLTFALNANRYDPETSLFPPVKLMVNLNQSTGDIAAIIVPAP